MADSTAVDDIVNRPYARVLVRDEDSGAYYAEILEIPDCFSEGDTPDEAIEALDDALRLNVRTSLEAGERIPEPLDAGAYSGKLVFRMPKSVHRSAAYRAQAEGVSINQLLLAALTRYLGAGDAEGTTMVIREIREVTVTTTAGLPAKELSEPDREALAKAPIHATRFHGRKEVEKNG